MTNRQNKAGWNDEQLDQLLVSFFSDEMPESLKKLPKSSPEKVRRSLTRISPDMRVQRRRSSAGRGSVIAGLVALSAVILTLISMPQTGSLSHLADSAASPAVIEPLDRSTISLPMMSVAVNRFESELGIVEQRTNLTWQNVAAYDPESGTEIAWSIPELEIELHLSQSPTVSLTKAEQEGSQ